jgi:hypothetical protein
LLAEEPDEVADIKRNVRPKKGRRFAFDAGEENKLTMALTDFLAQEGDIPVSETQIRSLLRRSGASDIGPGCELRPERPLGFPAGCKNTLSIWSGSSAQTDHVCTRPARHRISHSRTK